MNCWAVESISADKDIRLWVRFRPFEFPSARLRGVPLSPENAGEVLAAVESFLEASVAGESNPLRVVFFSVAKCTQRFCKHMVSKTINPRSRRWRILYVSGMFRMLWLVDDV